MGLFSNNKKRILESQNTVFARVSAVKPCWWLTVNKSALRQNNLESDHPKRITFLYEVDGITYTGKAIKSWCSLMHVGDTLTLYVDPSNPKRYVLKP